MVSNTHMFSAKINRIKAIHCFFFISAFSFLFTSLARAHTMDEDNEMSFPVGRITPTSKGKNREPKRFFKGESSKSSIAAMEEKDRISALPDCLLLDLLSRLDSTKEAIRTGTLSKRWEHLWPFVPVLIFNDLDGYHMLLSDFFSFPDKTLIQCHQVKLKKFELATKYNIRFESQIRSWVHHAVNCNVEELNLRLWTKELGGVFMLNELVFISSCFTHLKLEGCILNPVSAISWNKLKSLTITKGKLNEDLIKNVLLGSPLLETWQLVCCYGFRQLDITSKSLKNFLFDGYNNGRDVIEINAPNLLSLTIEGHFSTRKLLLQDVSSLAKAKLNFTYAGHFYHSEIGEMLKGVILSLRHVKEVEIGAFLFKTLTDLKANGFISPSNIKFCDSKLPLYPDGGSPLYSESDSDSSGLSLLYSDSDSD